MTTATEQLTKVEDQIIEALATIQKPVVEAIRTLAEKAEGYVPEVPTKDTVPSLDNLILSQFAFAERVLANQKDFVNALLEAIKPLSSKATITTKPKAKPRAKATNAAA